MSVITINLRETVTHAQTLESHPNRWQEIMAISVQLIRCHNMGLGVLQAIWNTMLYVPCTNTLGSMRLIR